MTAPAIRLDAARLRQAATLVQRFTGLRVELDVATTPAQVPPRCGKHAALVAELAGALHRALPPGRALVQQVGVALGGGTPTVPDMLVCPSGFLGSDDPFLRPQAVDIAVEIVLRGATAHRVQHTVDRYAAAGVRALLVVDPRPVTSAATGTWALHAEPFGGHYWTTRRGTYGDGARTIPLPPPFRGELPLHALPVY